MGYMISRYFGLHAFGTAYGFAFGPFMISGSAGILLMGAGYDRFHSYTVPLAALCTPLYSHSDVENRRFIHSAALRSR